MFFSNSLNNSKIFESRWLVETHSSRREAGSDVLIKLSKIAVKKYEPFFPAIRVLSLNLDWYEIKFFTVKPYASFFFF